MSDPRRIGAVVLTYNSVDDLPALLDGLLAQTGVDLRLIVVDNASIPEARSRMEGAFLERAPGGVVIGSADTTGDRLARVREVFVRNDRNAGYSAGNNIGARLAVAAGCEAVLVVNPDVRIADREYLKRLADGLFLDEKNVVATSAMRNLSGNDENPMSELSFVRELFLPMAMIGKVLGFARQKRTSLPQRAGPVEKVSGCCFLVRSDFLQEIGYFDENVFLYCEEAILAAQIRRVGRQAIYFPWLEAVHAHRPAGKGDPVRRQILWSRSRKYWHTHYAGYGELRRATLAMSHGLIIALTWLQSRAGGKSR